MFFVLLISLPPFYWSLLDDDEELDEEEIDEELALPQVLSSLSLPEKKELLRFKRDHNEVDSQSSKHCSIFLLSFIVARMGGRGYESTGEYWSKNGFRAIEAHENWWETGASEASQQTSKYSSLVLFSFINFTLHFFKARRAATKTVVFDADSDEEDALEAKTAKKKAPAKKETKPKGRPAGKGKRKVEQEEDEDEDFAAPQVDEEEDEDDLFDSDEEEKLSKKYRSAPVADEDEEEDDEAPKLRKTKTLRKRGRSMKVAAGSKARKRSRLDDLDDDDDDMEDGEVEDEDGEDNGVDDDERYQEDGDIGRIKKTFKPTARDSSTIRKTERSSNASKHIVLNSLDDYNRLLLQEHASAGGDREINELDIKTEEDDEPAAYQDYLRIFLRREDLAKMIHEPYFEKYVTGCYVRFLIDGKPGEAVYRCCEIVGVQHSEKAYKIDSGNGPVETKILLSLNSCGNTKERRRVDRISNHTITEHEIMFHIKGLQGRGMATITKWDVKKKRRQMKALTGGYVYSNEEIDTMIKAKTGMNNVFQTDHTSALEELKQKREKVRRQVPIDYELLDLISKEIEKLENGIEHDKEKFDKAYKLKAEINTRMRSQNTKRDMEAGMRQRQEEREAIAKGKQPNAITDPFVRRETRPKILFQTSSQIKAKEEEKKAADAAKAAAKAAGETAKPAEKAAAPVAKQSRARIDDDDWAIPLVIDMDQVL